MPHAEFLVLKGEYPRLFYNLDGSVGPRGRNQRLDIMLVQYFLQRAFSLPFAQSEPSPGGPIEVNGTFDRATVLGITHFQKLERLPVPDGQVDPIPPNHPTYARYTLAHLNGAANLAMGGSEAFFFSYKWAPMAPPQLTAAVQYRLLM
jgi:hypothetical protein